MTDNLINKVIIFTDLKDFTLKTSLFTNEEISDLIDKHEEIITPLVENYNWTIVKTIGDAYMILMDSSTNAAKLAYDIINKSKEYNKWINEELKKIEIRIAINVWEITEKQTGQWVDYFWETVNTASRLIEVTPANSIYCTSTFYNTTNKNEVQWINVGETNFKWIQETTEIYSLFEENLQNKKDVNSQISSDQTDHQKDELQEANNIIFNYSALSAFLTTQPIPFGDVATLIPVHVYMTLRLAKNHGIDIDYNMARTVFFQIIWILGLDYINKQIIINLSKIWLPVIAGYLIIPLTFWLTYWLGNVVNLYFFYQKRNIEVSNEYMKKLFKDKNNSGREKAKEAKDEILETWRNFKEQVFHHIRPDKKKK